jgi:hypothetical protein
MYIENEKKLRTKYFGTVKREADVVIVYWRRSITFDIHSWGTLFTIFY